MKTNNMSKIYGCKINGKSYVAIFETLGWNFYKITGKDTMKTTPTKGISFKDCELWENEEITNMGKKYMELKSFLYSI